MKALAGTLLVAVLAVAATAGAPPQPTLVGKAAPEISAKYWINVPPLTLAALRGKIVVVEFWATWCPPCRKSIPHLIELYKKYADKGVAIVSLTNEPQEKVDPFVKEMGMPYAIGGGSDSGRTYGVTGIPRVFLVDTKGQVVWEGHPMQPEFEKAIEEQLKTNPPAPVGPPARPKK
jgi:thiol-disulfide isomerase/thioredoxin